MPPEIIHQFPPAPGPDLARGIRVMHEQVRAHASPDPGVQQWRVENFAEHEVVNQVEDLQPVDLVLQRQFHFAAADGDGGARRPEFAVQEADSCKDAVGGERCGRELAGQDGEVGEAEGFVEACCV